METWSVKLEEDLKSKIQDIAKQDFNNNQDFMQALISLYEMNQLKETGSVLSGEIEEIQKLTNRIVNLFIHSNDKATTLLEDKDKLLQNELLSKETTIKMLQESLRQQELKYNDIAAINDTLAESNQEHGNEIIELNKSKETLASLVDEYKQKNDTLTGLLQEYKGDREENKALKSKSEALSLELHHLQIEEGNKTKELEALKRQMDEELEKYKQLIEDLQSKHVSELEHTKRNAEVEANLTILKLQQEHQEKVSSLNMRHSSELEKLNDKHTTAIEGYQAKYKDLLEQLEAKQAANRELEKLNDKHTTAIKEYQIKCNNLSEELEATQAANRDLEIIYAETKKQLDAYIDKGKKGSTKNHPLPKKGE